ncbi:carbohydrate ABC transporter permease [Devosia ginsengisoli]|uniref:carbohydrate ABC transporter permease n=1 Tax=Devosia ginsengisoli TaxID=400770 RepID=UPI0026EB494F|nr:carbohydrate ABC transporter permease [Devosia ginsengisoli]MCR6670081.1 carbohydrate ABC transporter permease [Devosia ginsengisoli]
MKTFRLFAHYAVLILAALIVLFPLYFTIAGALMTDAQLMRFPPMLVPQELHFENFAKVLDAMPLIRQFFNSIFVASAIVLGVLVTSVLAAYVLVFLNIPFKNVIFGIIMLTILVPTESLIVPKYLILVDLRWINSYPGLIVPFVASGFGIFLMRQFFLSFPKEIYEAARIDGCGHLRFVLTILVPIVRPALGVLGLYTFIGAYNMYFWPLLVINTPDMQTLQIGLQALNSSESTQPSLIYAGAAIAIAPMLVIFYLFQKSIVRGLTSGAVK